MIVLGPLPFQAAYKSGNASVWHRHVQLAGVDDHSVVSVQKFLNPGLDRLVEVLTHVTENCRVKVLVDRVAHVDGMSHIVPLDVLLVKAISFWTLLLQKVFIEIESCDVLKVGWVWGKISVK